MIEELNNTVSVLSKCYATQVHEILRYMPKEDFDKIPTRIVTRQEYDFIILNGFCWTIYDDSFYSVGLQVFKIEIKEDEK